MPKNLQLRLGNRRKIFTSKLLRYDFFAISCQRTLLTYTIQTAQNSSIRIAINIGVFEAIPTRGKGVTIAELAQELNVNEHLLGKSKAQKCW